MEWPVGLLISRPDFLVSSIQTLNDLQPEIVNRKKSYIQLFFQFLNF